MISTDVYLYTLKKKNAFMTPPLAILHGQQDAMYDDRSKVGPAGGQADARLQSSGVLQETQDAASSVLHL